MAGEAEGAVTTLRSPLSNNFENTGKINKRHVTSHQQSDAVPLRLNSAQQSGYPQRT